MDQDQAIQLAAHVLHVLGTKATSREIAEHARSTAFRLKRIDGQFDTLTELEQFDLTSRLTRAIKKHMHGTRDGRQAIVGTAGGGWELGPGAPHLLIVTHEDLKRPVDTQFTGLVGEYAVMSELSACNWNVAKMAYDDGVDIVAIKDRDLRTVQVKTAHAQRNKSFQFIINQASHKHHQTLHHYYVLVMRTMQINGYLNEFLILNAQEMNALEVSGNLTPAGDKKLKLTVQVADGSAHIGGKEYRHLLNRFSTLFY